VSAASLFHNTVLSPIRRHLCDVLYCCMSFPLTCRAILPVNMTWGSLSVLRLVLRSPGYAANSTALARCYAVRCLPPVSMTLGIRCGALRSMQHSRQYTVNSAGISRCYTLCCLLGKQCHSDRRELSRRFHRVLYGVRGDTLRTSTVDLLCYAVRCLPLVSMTMAFHGGALHATPNHRNSLS
jgi:hypothetical protein